MSREKLMGNPKCGDFTTFPIRGKWGPGIRDVWAQPGFLMDTPLFSVRIENYNRRFWRAWVSLAKGTLVMQESDGHRVKTAHGPWIHETGEITTHEDRQMAGQNMMLQFLRRWFMPGTALYSTPRLSPMLMALDVGSLTHSPLWGWRFLPGWQQVPICSEDVAEQA